MDIKLSNTLKHYIFLVDLILFMTQSEKFRVYCVFGKRKAYWANFIGLDSLGTAWLL